MDAEAEIQPFKAEMESNKNENLLSELLPKPEVVKSNKNENLEPRGQWSGRLDFIVSCLGYAVGLGNVWRFPYLVFKNGGGAFLIPYLVSMVVIGMPLFVLEVAIGQYSNMGPINSYKNMAPLFEGLGYANFFVSALLCTYYNVIMSWTLSYLYNSLTTSALPWEGCSNDFNSEFCFSVKEYNECVEARGSSNHTAIYHLGQCLESEEELGLVRSNLSHYYRCSLDDSSDEGVYVSHNSSCRPKEEVSSITELFDIPRHMRISSSQEYFTRKILDESDGIDDMRGGVQPHLAVALAVSWAAVFFSLIKGIKSSGRVVYFTVSFPYLIMTVLLVRAVTLEGALEGILFYVTPDWDRIWDVRVWEAAANQIFFSLSLSGGSLVTLASYNKFHNNLVRDAIIISLCNAGTSIFAGFAIFSVLGFLASQLQVPVDAVVQDGSGLAFVAYPDLVTSLPLAPLWSCMFFVMLFFLGLDTQFAMVETLLTGILDFAPKWRKQKTWVIGGICVAGILAGLPLTTRAGGYLVDFLDFYVGWPLMVLGLAEFVLVACAYGVDNFLRDLNHMVGFDPGEWSKSHFVCLFSTLSPLLLTVLIVASWLEHHELTRGEYVFPQVAIDIGRGITLATVAILPISAAVHVFKKMMWEVEQVNWTTLKTVLIEGVRPTTEWGENCRNSPKTQSTDTTQTA